MKILLENLIFSGIHGFTDAEKMKPQRFRVDIETEVFGNSKGDNLETTADYRKIKAAAKNVIEGGHCDLIETLACRIADAAISDPKIFSIKVKVSKPEVWYSSSGVPAVEVTRRALEKSFQFLDFDIDRILADIFVFGGVSFPVLGNFQALDLFAEALRCSYDKRQEYYGKHGVHQDLWVFEDFREDSAFLKLRDDFTDMINYKLSTAKVLRPYDKNVSFNEAIMQKYEKDSSGITPHMDGLSYIDLIAVFLIYGKGDFYLCRDREGRDPRKLDGTPGNVILLRAPGFMGSQRRPFHCLKNITEERYTFGLRHNKSKTAK